MNTRLAAGSLLIFCATFACSNDLRTGATARGLETDPDLIVTEVSGPPSATQGQSITIRNTVCNVGGGWAPSSDLLLVLSSDTMIDTFDHFLEVRWVPDLAPGQCNTADTPTGAFAPDGAYYLGGIADSSSQIVEDDETNNTLAGGQIGIGNGPDLIVTAIDGPPTANGQFEIESTICNQGTSWSSGSEVNFYASIDQEIIGQNPPGPGSDWFLGSRWVPSLSPGQCDTAASQVYPPPAQEEHYLGAIVDEYEYVSELIENNNTFSGEIIGFGNGPDLIVTAISGPPSADGSFEVSTTVCNQGTQWGGWTEVHLYASLDDIITGINPPSPTSDFFIGSRSVQGLDPGQCQTQTDTYFSPPSTGAHYLGTIVDEDELVPELIESNNTTLGGLIGFGSGPDYIVQALSGPPSADGTFNLVSTVCNQGTQSGGGFEVTFYASSDQTITGQNPPPPGGDFFLGNRWIGYLNAGQCDTGSIQANAPPATGAFYLGAIADEFQSQPELIESNNTFTGGLIGFGNGPDFIVSAVTGPPSANGNFTLRSTVCNQGTQWSGPTQVTHYASADTTIDPDYPGGNGGDYYLGGRGAPSLAPGQCDTQDVMAWSPPVFGAYYLGGVVDEYENTTELIEVNNSFTGGLIGFGNGPDFIITALEGPPSANGSFDLVSTVCNQGTQGGDSTEVTFYASDFFIGSRGVPFLSPGQCDTQTTQAWPPPQFGAHYLRGVVDPNNWVSELIEVNNTFTGALTGFGNGPDLIVRSVDGPPSANNQFTINAVVCNQGTQSSGSSELYFYASSDPIIDGDDNPPPSGDWFLGATSVPGLQAGQCVHLASNAWPPPQGAYYLGAIVDQFDSQMELIESNNTLTGELIGFGNNPDLIVTSIVAPGSANGSFDIEVTVCNQGTSSSYGSELTFYASADETITPQNPWTPVPDYYIGGRTVSSLAPGECDTQVTNVWTPPAQGPHYLGAVVDEYENLPELIESNNTLLGDLIGFGNGPDYIVTAVSGPPSAANQQFALNWTACNQGTQLSPGVEIQFYAGGHPIGMANTSDLDAGECESGSSPAWTPPAQGAHAIIAVIDPQNFEVELIESNNTFQGPTIGFGNGPDLVITEISGPPFAMPNGQITLEITVCNQGTQGSGGAQLQLWATLDDEINTIEEWFDPDWYLGSVFVPPLAASACDTQSYQTGAPNQPGEYGLAGRYDPDDFEPELNEGNNDTIDGTLIVAYEFCGNNATEPGEQCDDGNFESGDGCTSDCVDEFCGDGVVNDGGIEQCDDSNTSDADGCSATCIVEVPYDPWRINANGNQYLNIAWNYAMGYHFTTLVQGHITRVGGFFNGTKIVRLFNRNTGALLATANVTAANNWGYTNIAPIAVPAGGRYTVAVYLAGSGGSYRSPIQTLPRTYGNVRIDGSTFVVTSGGSSPRPTNIVTSTMYGQGDFTFVPLAR